MAGKEAGIASLKADFERDGVVVLRAVVTAEQIEGLRIDVDAQIKTLGTSPTAYDLEAVARQTWQDPHLVPNTGPAARFDMSAMKTAVRSDPLARPLRDGTGQEAGMFFYDAANWKHQDGVRGVALDSSLPALIAALLGAQHLHFWEDTSFVKAPWTAQRTAFHQDLAYFQIAGDQCAIVWIPLDPVTKANGAMEYVRGSHLWGQIFAPNVFFAQTPFATSPFPRLPDIEGQRDAFDIVSFEVEPGDVIVHHVRTVHGAGGNLSDQMRRAISLRYCGDQVRYHNQIGAIAQFGVSASLHDGEGLGGLDYPLVWPRPWPGLKLAPLYPRSQPKGQNHA
jgi:hypothetical protein